MTWRVPRGRGQDGQQFGKMEGIVVRPPNECEINEVAVGKVCSGGHRVPQVFPVLEFENSPEFCVGSDHSRPRLPLRQLGQRLG